MFNLLQHRQQMLLSIKQVLPQIGRSSMYIWYQ